MSFNLVIVESPAKAKTIQKYLGKGYEVVASMGHVRDLPKSQLGIDVENDFAMKYITIRGKGDKIKEVEVDDDKMLIANWSKETALREDESGEMLSPKDVINNAPRHSGNYIEVPVVIGEES